jgi:hypothetical protein
MNMGPILNSCGDMCIWNTGWASRCGHVHGQSSTPKALQLANSAVRLCSQTFHYIIRLWAHHLHFPMKNMWICISSTIGFVMTMWLLYWRWYPQWRIPDRCLLSNVYRQFQGSGLIPSVSTAECPVWQCGWGRKHYWNGAVQSMC